MVFGQGRFGQGGYGAQNVSTGPAKAEGASELIKDTTTQGFRQDVMAESMKQPVLVDFWAPWCGPCRQLTPVLEKAVKAAGGKVKLVKMNIDEHPQIAGQLGVQSIPAVFAFDRGQPVDAFMGAQSEAQVKAFIERLIGPQGPNAVEEVLAAAEAKIAEKDLPGAAELYAAVLDAEPENLKALGGLARLYVTMGMPDQARQMLAGVPAEKANDTAIAGARAAIEAAEAAASLGDVREIEARIAANPADHQARIDLAVALNARGRRDEATDQLIESIRRDRAWNDGAARKQLVQFFEAWGLMDEASVAGRRKLSAVLYS